MTLEYTPLPGALAAPIDAERPWVVFGACRDMDGETFFPATKDEIDRALGVLAKLG